MYGITTGNAVVFATSSALFCHHVYLLLFHLWFRNLNIQRHFRPKSGNYYDSWQANGISFFVGKLLIFVRKFLKVFQKFSVRLVPNHLKFSLDGSKIFQNCFQTFCIVFTMGWKSFKCHHRIFGFWNQKSFFNFTHGKRLFFSKSWQAILADHLGFINGIIKFET